MLKINDLHKSYGTKQVLKGINLSLESGKVYGIVGKNGAGKTTLFKCIAGLEDYTGEIDSPFQPLKNHLGWLETSPILMSRITGWEYLKLLCVARGVDTENFEEQNIFQLPLDEYAVNYSTGMKKKLALMGVLLQENNIYILDEPFNGVDIQSNMMIEGIIEKLRQANKTVIISSHIFSTLSSTCDEIKLLSDGQIIRTVLPNEYADLEKSMKEEVLTDAIQHLRIV